MIHMATYISTVSIPGSCCVLLTKFITGSSFAQCVCLFVCLIHLAVNPVIVFFKFNVDKLLDIDDIDVKVSHMHEVYIM